MRREARVARVAKALVGRELAYGWGFKPARRTARTGGQRLNSFDEMRRDRNPLEK